MRTEDVFFKCKFCGVDAAAGMVHSEINHFGVQKITATKPWGWTYVGDSLWCRTCDPRFSKSSS